MSEWKVTRAHLHVLLDERKKIHDNSKHTHTHTRAHAHTHAHTCLSRSLHPLPSSLPLSPARWLSLSGTGTHGYTRRRSAGISELMPPIRRLFAARSSPPAQHSQNQARPSFLLEQERPSFRALSEQERLALGEFFTRLLAQTRLQVPRRRSPRSLLQRRRR